MQILIIGEPELFAGVAAVLGVGIENLASDTPCNCEECATLKTDVRNARDVLALISQCIEAEKVMREKETPPVICLPDMSQVPAVSCQYCPNREFARARGKCCQSQGESVRES